MGNVPVGVPSAAPTPKEQPIAFGAHGTDRQVSESTRFHPIQASAKALGVSTPRGRV
jgi:hypothetical protein